MSRDNVILHTDLPTLSECIDDISTKLKRWSLKRKFDIDEDSLVLLKCQPGPEHLTLTYSIERKTRRFRCGEYLTKDYAKHEQVR